MRPKFTMIMVSTLDGVISQDLYQDSFTWTSKEDKEHFLQTIRKIGYIIMGNTTFKAIKEQPYEGVYHFILTSNERKWGQDSGKKVEYVGGNLINIAGNLYDKGCKEIAVLGGAKTNAEFLNAGIVDEFYITIEPKIFGRGIRLTETMPLNIDLQLIEVCQLNSKGTLLAHYRINHL